MQGLIARLDPEYEKKVIAIWEELRSKHGLTALLDLELEPHFTFFVVGDCIPGEQIDKMAELLENLPSFEIRTAGGLGIFNETDPVIYLPITRDRILSSLHHKIWEEIGSECETRNPLYSPPVWIPHITLAHIDLTREMIPDVITTLLDRSLSWEISITQLSLISGDLTSGFREDQIFNLR